MKFNDDLPVGLGAAEFDRFLFGDRRRHDFDPAKLGLCSERLQEIGHQLGADRVRTMDPKLSFGSTLSTATSRFAVFLDILNRINGHGKSAASTAHNDAIGGHFLERAAPHGARDSPYAHLFADKRTNVNFTANCPHLRLPEGQAAPQHQQDDANETKTNPAHPKCSTVN